MFGGMIAPSLLEGPMGFTTFCDPSNWTLDSEWDSREGDLGNIAAATASDRISGFAFNSDGSRLVISNSAEDEITSFSLSTVFDPETASELAGSPFAVTNPTYLFFVKSGNAVRILEPSANKISEYSAAGYAVPSSSTLQSDLTKSEVDFADPEDGQFTTSEDGSIIYWAGESTGDLVYVPGVTDLDNPGTHVTEPNTSISAGSTNSFSQLDITGTKWFYVTAAGLVRLCTVDSVGDVSSLTVGSSTDIAALLTYSWSPNRIWIDPNDTRYVWVAGEEGAGIQMAKFAQNCS